MNQSFYESRSREKINNRMKEGMMSQAYYRSRSSKAGLLRRLPRFILIGLVIWGLIQFLL